MKLPGFRSAWASAALSLALSSPGYCSPTVFPTGTTIYEPDKAWNGFTVLSPLGTPAVIVLDMDGRVVKRWDGFDTSSGGPARVLPGGVVVAPNGSAHGGNGQAFGRDGNPNGQRGGY